MGQSLHPNLAKLAASYDELLERYANGHLSAAAARSEIATLVARDDDGILWSIDPDSGQWLRRTRSGNLVPGEPPTYGLATPTPHDLSGNPNAFVPDSRIDHYLVENEAQYNPGQFTGVTRSPRVLVAPTATAAPRTGFAVLRQSRLVRWAVLTFFVAVVGGGTWLATHQSPSVVVTPVVTTTTAH